jgi:hypothetical protein
MAGSRGVRGRVSIAAPEPGPVALPHLDDPFAGFLIEWQDYCIPRRARQSCRLYRR